MIDGNRLVRLHAVRLVGEVVRRRWGLWCGLVLPGGDRVPIGARAGIGPALCLALQGRRDSSGSCERSVRSWSVAHEEHRTDAPEGIISLACHAGLKTLLRPLHHRDEFLGTLYISGFWDETGASEEVFEVEHRQTLRRLHELGLRGEDPRAVPLLDAHERAFALELLQAAALEIEGFVAAQERQGALQPSHRYANIIGQSASIMELFRMLDKVSASDSTVLIQGENGTGKELIARAIHFHSKRRERPFVVQNCSALNDNLLDSELFGHKKGSFTGAVTDKQGLFALANGGTFFLDEVGDMSPTLQVKMLRVLQEGTFLPVGDTVVRKVDVRIIAATNRPLKTMVKEGSFREDLYYRLNVINLVVPPLRERRSDIPLLIEHFLERAVRTTGTGRQGRCVMSQPALRRMMSYPWPGNIRELENEVERFVVLADEDGVIHENLLSRRLLSNDAASLDESLPTRDLPAALETLERRMLLEGLRRTGWNKTRTAKELGISRRNLIRKVERYNLVNLRER